MRQLRLLLFFLICYHSAYAQVVGTVQNENGEALPFVNIYPQDSFTGTTSNEKGHYQLELYQSGTYTIVFQFLGYKTLRKTVNIDSFPYELDAVLSQESISLEEVLLTSGENPANKIMRQAIEKRAFHKQQLKAYTADFYSRGIWRLKNAPEKILGQEIGDLGGSLDSTRSGIVYLSETISKIDYRAPDDFKEKILASKVSGNDNGFSLNSAQEATISFYQNTVDLNSQLISPLADYAFNYYNFKLDGIFNTPGGSLINKISVVPKRPNDKVFSGHIYIEENSWQIYGLELRTNGAAMQAPFIEELIIKQNFNYSEEVKRWVPISQTVDFSFGMFGITGNGRFTAVYTNYDFNPDFTKNNFGPEILSFAPEANKKDSLFWSEQRPIPLTEEETKDYLKKDSIQEKRESKTYLDSVDQVRNKFSVSNLLFGYTYRNSFKKWQLNVDSPLFNTHVNTVQGYNSELEISFRKNTSENFGDYWRLFTNTEYSFSEDRLRISGGFQQQFNSFSRPVLKISGGMRAAQINDQEPISESINDITTSFFERNYLKLYDLLFAEVSFGQEVLNGLEIKTSVSVEKRSPLFNKRTSFWVDREEVQFSSNNPLEPYNFNSAPFEEDEITKFSFSARYVFGQQYLKYPNFKFNIPNEKYPVLSLNYEKGFFASIDGNDFDHLQLGIAQDLRIGNKGKFGYRLKGGSFFNDEKISFLDYRHFNGNETAVGTSDTYLNSFNLLPYYAFSTKTNYAEAHIEHNFEKWVLGKIPLVNRLDLSLVMGAHQLYRQNEKTYSEINIGLDNLGIGKFRFLRVDYVQSFYNGQREAKVIFGLKFLDLLGL